MNSNPSEIEYSLLEKKSHNISDIDSGGRNEGSINSSKFYESSLYWKKYHWEFKRRSPEYQEYYKKCQEACKEYQNRIKNFQKDYDEYLDRVGCEEESKSYSHGYLNTFHTDLDLLRQKYRIENGISSTPSPKASFDEAFDSDIEIIKLQKEYSRQINNGKLTITIDFAKVNSIPTLKRHVSNMIEKGFKQFKQTNVKKKTKKQIDYSVILMVGDLRTDGSTYEQIAKKIFPQDFKNNLSSNPESAIRKVGQYNATYKKLTNGGYKDLIFP